MSDQFLTLTYEIGDAREIRREFEGRAEDLRQALGEALWTEAEIEMTESKMLVPVDTGALRDTGKVDRLEFTPEGIEVVLKFGGLAPNGTLVDYAAAVHEDAEMFHDDGQAFFLSSVLDDSADDMLGRVAARVREILNG